MWDRNVLRDMAKAVFAKKPEQPRRSFENATSTDHERQDIDHERQLQHRELATIAHFCYDLDMKTARAQAALEHANPKNWPPGMSRPPTRNETERRAQMIYQGWIKPRHDAIDAKPHQELKKDAAIRARDGTEKNMTYQVVTVLAKDRWQKGAVLPGIYTYNAKVEDRPQVDGLDGGHISKLVVRDRNDKEIARYSQGWEKEPPRGSLDQAVVDTIIGFYNEHVQALRPAVDEHFMDRQSGGPRLLDNMSPDLIGRLIRNAGDLDTLDATLESLKEPLAASLTAEERAAEIKVRIADIEAMQQTRLGVLQPEASVHEYKVYTRRTDEAVQKGALYPGFSRYQATFSDEPSPYGIKGGCVTNLVVRSKENEDIASYNGEWTIKPAEGSMEAAMVDAIVDYYGGHSIPPEEAAQIAAAHASDQAIDPDIDPGRSL